MIKCFTIGASAGGLKALKQLLPALPADFPAAILIVQHISDTSGNYLPDILDDLCQIRVKEAEVGEAITQGVAYVAPPNYHLLVESGETIFLSTEAKINFSRPAIDPLFQTAATAYFDNLCGIILTGANADGSSGLLAVKQAGGLAIVQDPATAEVDTMPQAAIDNTDVDYIMPLVDIAATMIKLVKD